MNRSPQGSKGASGKAVFDRTVKEAVRQAKLKGQSDPSFVPPSDDANFIMAVRSFASRPPIGNRPLSFGTHLLGGQYDGSVDVSLTVDATKDDDPNTIVSRGASGEFSAGNITATFFGDITSTNGSIAHLSVGDATATGNVTATGGTAAFLHVTATDLALQTMPAVAITPSVNPVAATHTVPMVFNGVTYNVLLKS